MWTTYAAVALLVMAAVAASAAIYILFGIDKIQNWLLWAVTQAEKQYGSGTGKLKLAYVYDIFVSKFPKLQAVIPYSLFSKLVDKSLETMREMLKNTKISDIIKK